MNTQKFQTAAFIFLLICVSLAFLAILVPFYEAIFWSVALAILFAPVNRKFVACMPRHPTWAALLTLALCLSMVVVPILLLIGSVVQEAASVYERVRTGNINFAEIFGKIDQLLPAWLADWLPAWLDRLGIGTLDGIKEKLSLFAAGASQFLATKAVNIGQNTFQFGLTLCIMLYLFFFMLRDGVGLAGRLKSVAPLDNAYQSALTEKFVTVVRATIKGNVIVAVVQGVLGGFIFWVLGVEAAILWGVIMAFLSLLPAVGASLVWGPVAIYFFAVGDIVRALVLAAFGAGVIGLVDNILRPVLVGKDTQMPDYLVLISTLGGIALFGLNGFVIGPVIAALFISVWDIFARTKMETEGCVAAVKAPNAKPAPPSRRRKDVR